MFLKQVPFGARKIGKNGKAVVIAEIGINHEGSLARCQEMVVAAAQAGADAIKLQTVNPDKNYTRGSESYDLYKRSQLSMVETKQVFDLAHSLGLEYLTTCGDLETLAEIEAMNPAAHKISSGLHTHLPLIAKIAALGRTVILSTGMGSEETVADAVAEVAQAKNSQLVVMQCTSVYPVPYTELNLATIEAMSSRFGVPCGFSDHSVGHRVGPYAVAFGACVIEKHFTLDSARWGYDHAISLEPLAFKQMVDEIRFVEMCRGSALKQPSEEERDKSSQCLRYLVASRDLKSNQVLGLEDIAYKRLGPIIEPGIAPKFYRDVLGKRCIRKIAQDNLITLADLASE